MGEMARLRFGALTEAWKGEATDFTPLLADQLDALGAEIGVDLASIGESEVPTAGGRRIDIVAQGEDGSEFVVENQYGKADHDHLVACHAPQAGGRPLPVFDDEYPHQHTTDSSGNFTRQAWRAEPEELLKTCIAKGWLEITLPQRQVLDACAA